MRKEERRKNGKNRKRKKGKNQERNKEKRKRKKEKGKRKKGKWKRTEREERKRRKRRKEEKKKKSARGAIFAQNSPSFQYKMFYLTMIQSKYCCQRYKTFFSSLRFWASKLACCRQYYKTFLA
jgi:hypothetical protein